MTTSSLALAVRAAVERRLWVVLDHQLARLGRGPVDQHLHEPQRHVDPARHAGRRDDPPVEMFDDAVARRDGAVLGERVERAPVRRRGQSVEEAAAASTSEPVHTEVVNVVVSCAVRTQSRTRSSCISARVPTPPGNTMTSGRRVVLERAVDLDAEHRVVGADHAAFVADERDVEVGDPLEHLVRPDAVERGEVGEQGDDDLGHVTVCFRVGGGNGGGSRRATRRCGGRGCGASSRRCRTRSGGRSTSTVSVDDSRAWRAVSTRMRATNRAGGHADLPAERPDEVSFAHPDVSGEFAHAVVGPRVVDHELLGAPDRPGRRLADPRRRGELRLPAGASQEHHQLLGDRLGDPRWSGRAPRGPASRSIPAVTPADDHTSRVSGRSALGRLRM